MKLEREMVALNNAVWKPPRLTGSFWWEKIHPENDSILNLNSDYHTKLQLIPCMTSGGFGNIMITKACQTITETHPFFFDRFGSTPCICKDPIFAKCQHHPGLFSVGDLIHKSLLHTAEFRSLAFFGSSEPRNILLDSYQE